MSEWIEIDLPYGPVYDYDESDKMQQQDSFDKRELNKPGIMIELEDGKQYLIGDINPLRGVCDDCVEFDKMAIVKRYREIDLS